MTVERRAVLAMLGLASLTTAAIATEDVGEKSGPYSIAARGEDFQDRMATALEKLAAGIRSREVNVQKLNIRSDFDPNDWLVHELNITFELPDYRR